MLKLLKFAFLPAAILLFCVSSSTLSAQEASDWSITNRFAGGRATAVERFRGQNQTANDGWRTSPQPLLVRADLSDRASGSVSADYGLASHRLNLSSATERLSIADFHRSREVAEASSTWTYTGATPRVFTFVLTLDGDIGREPFPKPFGFFRLPDVAIANNERGNINGGINLILPNGDPVFGFLDGPTNQNPTFFFPRDLDAELFTGLFGIPGNGMYMLVFDLLVEPGDTLELNMNSNSDVLRRPGGNLFGPILTRVTTELQIFEAMDDGPFRL